MPHGLPQTGSPVLNRSDTERGRKPSLPPWMSRRLLSPPPSRQDSRGNSPLPTASSARGWTVLVLPRRSLNLGHGSGYFGGRARPGVKEKLLSPKQCTRRRRMAAKGNRALAEISGISPARL